MKNSDVVLKTTDEELMDAIRETDEDDRVYVAGIKYDVDGYTIGPAPHGEDEVLVAGLDRVHPDTIMRCPNCEEGEKIQVEDDRFASGFRWECNYCNWRQEV